MIDDVEALEVLAEASEELAVEEDAVCRHCFGCRRDHAAELKCLFVATSFEPALCKGCGLPHMRATGDGLFFINPMNERGYHLACDPMAAELDRLRDELLRVFGLPKEFLGL